MLGGAVGLSFSGDCAAHAQVALRCTAEHSGMPRTKALARSSASAHRPARPGPRASLEADHRDGRRGHGRDGGIWRARRDHLQRHEPGRCRAAAGDSIRSAQRPGPAADQSVCDAATDHHPKLPNCARADAHESARPHHDRRLGLMVVEAARWRQIGTNVDVVTSDAPLEPARAAVAQLIADADDVLSRFRPDSELSCVNRAAGRWMGVSVLLGSAIADGTRRSAAHRWAGRPKCRPRRPQRGLRPRFRAAAWPGRATAVDARGSPRLAGDRMGWRDTPAAPAARR